MTVPQPLPEEPSKNRSLSPKATELLVVLSFAYFPALVDSFLYLLSPRSQGGAPPSLVGFLGTTAHLIGVSVVLLYIVRINQGSWRELGLVRPCWNDASMGVLLLFLAWAAAWLGDFAVAFLRPGSLEETDALIRHAIPHVRMNLDYAIAVVTSLVVGFTEELLFRGFILTRWKQISHSVPHALLVSTLLFGLYHAYQGFAGMASTAILGLIFGLAFLASKRLWPIAIAHALFDIISFMA